MFETQAKYYRDGNGGSMKSVVLKHFMRLILRLRPSYMILVLVNLLVATEWRLLVSIYPSYLSTG